MSGIEAYTVLIIGNDAEFTYLIRYYIKTAGYQAAVASIDGDVVALAAQKRPAVIVLDPDIMESASQDVLRALKTDQSTRDLPVLVCSWQERDASLLAQGADSYLQKPVSYGEFLAVLEGVAYISAE